MLFDYSVSDLEKFLPDTDQEKTKKKLKDVPVAATYMASVLLAEAGRGSSSLFSDLIERIFGKAKEREQVKVSFDPPAFIREESLAE